jgi:hypothetical protein
MRKRITVFHVTPMKGYGFEILGEVHSTILAWKNML